MIILGNLFYTKNKNILLRRLLYISYSLTALLIIDVTSYYIAINHINYPKEWCMVFILSCFLLSDFGVVYTVTSFSYTLTQNTISNRFKVLYVFYCSIPIFIIFVLFLFFQRSKISCEIFIHSSLVIHNLITAIGAYYNIIYLFHNKQKIDSKYKKLIRIGLQILIVIISLSVLSNVLDCFIDISYPNRFSPMIYFLLNILGLNLAKTTFSQKNVETQGKEPQSLGDYLNTFNLTEREIEIVRYIRNGQSNSDIAKILFISTNTVRNHIYNIYKKMGIKNRYQLISSLADLNQVK